MVFREEWAMPWWGRCYFGGARRGKGFFLLQLPSFRRTLETVERGPPQTAGSHVACWIRSCTRKAEDQLPPGWYAAHIPPLPSYNLEPSVKIVFFLPIHTLVIRRASFLSSTGLCSGKRGGKFRPSLFQHHFVAVVAFGPGHQPLHNSAGR